MSMWLTLRAPSVPAPEDAAAAEPAEPGPAPRGPVLQEIDLTLDKPADRALFQPGTLPSELRSAILHHGRQKTTVCSQQREWKQAFPPENTIMHILGLWK